MKKIENLIYQNRGTARLHKKTSIHSAEGTFCHVEPPKMNPVFVAQRCCLRCGRVEDIGAESIDSCEDCQAMAFNID